jgi:uncharacterized phage protein gp47/JayE
MNYNEEISEIQSDMLSEMPSTYSKLKGTWLWEMFKAFAMKIYELLQLLTDTADKLNIENLQGDELDAYVQQWTDLTRKKAQKASGYIEVTGKGTIYSGTLVSADGVQYEVVSDVTVKNKATVPIVAVETGESGNTSENTVTTMVTSNANVKSITNPKAIEGGTDEETDNALRERYYLRLSMPATSGNKAHYILWATECAGVGGAKATRDSKVANKVNVYICNDEGETADKTTIKLVQDYIDPNKNGDGSGTAPIGAICEVYSAGIKKITIGGTVEIDNTIDSDEVLANIKSDIGKYLSQINFQKTELSYAKLLNIALSSDGVSDITDFKLNNGYVNVTCTETQIFSLSSFGMEVG